MSTSVSVFARFRPPNEQEVRSETVNGGEEGNYIVAEKFEDNVVRVKTFNSMKEFKFNHVFTAEDSQTSVYRRTAKQLIPGLLQGINASVMAYGQSGSGKTYSMFGPTFQIGGRRTAQPQVNETSAQMGIIPRAMDDLFYQIELASTETVQFAVHVGFVQIYNEKVTDLIVPETGRLKVRQNQSGEWFIDSSIVCVSTTEDVMLQIERGLNNRITKSTSLNDVSSRSHAILRISVIKHDLSDGSSYPARIDFCDLAGSESAYKSMASSDTLREAGFINKSLLHLREVINYLGRRKRNSGNRHLMYRNSNLTKLLYDSLGGNSNSLLLLNVSPHAYNSMETVATLKFGTTAQRIMNFVVVQKYLSGKELQKACERAKQRVTAQEFLIRKKSKEIRRNHALMMEVLSQIDRASPLYAQLQLRLPHVIQCDAQVNKNWGKLLLPEILLLQIFAMAGCATSVSSIFVCKDWRNFLTDDKETNQFWSAVGKNEGVEKGECFRGTVVDFVMKHIREKQRKLREKFEDDLKHFRNAGGLSLVGGGIYAQ